MILIYSRIRKILLQLVMRLPRPDGDPVPLRVYHPGTSGRRPPVAFAEVMGRLRRFLHRSSAEPAATSGRER